MIEVVESHHAKGMTQCKINPTIYLSDSYRIRILDHLQWVLEHRRPGIKSGGARWDAYAYCHTRVGLETALSRLRCDYDLHLKTEEVSSFPKVFPQIMPEHSYDTKRDEVA